MIENTIEDLKKLLLEHRITVCAINSLEIYQSDLFDEKNSELFSKLEWMAKAADELGANYIITAPMLNDNNGPYEENKKYLKALYQKLSDYFSKYKVKLGFEIISLSPAMVPDLACAIELIKEINRSNIGLCFDCLAFYSSNSSIEDIRRIPLEKLYIVHINDARKGFNKDSVMEKDRRFPGEGEIPLKEIVSELKRLGYDGIYSIELITPYIWEWDTARAIKHAYKTTKNILYPVYKNHKHLAKN